MTKRTYKYRTLVAEKQRVKRGWSFQRLGQEAHLSTKTVIDFIRSGYGREKTMRRVAEALDVPIEELLPEALAKAS